MSNLQRINFLMTVDKAIVYCRSTFQLFEFLQVYILFQIVRLRFTSTLSIGIEIKIQ